MSGIDERRDAADAKMHHDSEIAFRAIARRNKKLGAWAGGLLGKEGEALDAYVKEVVMSDFEETGDNDVLRKVAADLAGSNVSQADVRAKMDELFLEASREIQQQG